MTQAQRDLDADQAWTISPFTVIWKSVVPALGVALMLGASVLAACAVAAAASLVIIVGFAAGRSFSSASAHAAPRGP